MKKNPQLVEELISDHLKTTIGPQLSDLEREELPAIISHWLMNHGEMVPLLPPAIIKPSIEYIKNNLPRMLPHNRIDSKIFQLETGASLRPQPKPVFRFIDLFAGIGGFRIAFQKHGGQCVFTSEWDKFAKQTYRANFGETPYGDIHNVLPEAVPDHDVLCAGFPCQPFSLAGVSKKNSMGRKHGFEDKTQGTLFFDICRILKAKRPRAFFLENVKNLVSHNQGDTFKTIIDTLEGELGYTVNYKIVDGGNWVPQHRERIFIVGFDPAQTGIEDRATIKIPQQPGTDYVYPELSKIINEVEDGYMLGPGTWDTLVRHKAHHAKAGNGFGYGLHTLPIPDGARTRTISARYHKDGAEILIDTDGPRPRKITIEEAAQLQGFDPDLFSFPVSNTQAYRQLGNSVVVPAITATAREVCKLLLKGK